MQRFQYTQPLARRLGVAATIAVGIVKHRQRRHVVEVYFRDTAGANQVGVFEVSKERAIFRRCRAQCASKLSARPA